MRLPAGLTANFAQGADEPLPIRVIAENGLAPVAPIHHVVNRTGMFGIFHSDSELGRHRLKTAPHRLDTSIAGIDPFPIPLPGNEKSVGWSSGHRVDRKEPESWATASVFSFAQCSRSFIGIWTREAAAERLRVFTATRPEEDRLKKLTDHGNTWTNDTRSRASTESNTAATQLMTLLVNPALCFGSGH
jgi:hypothetical protein